jgi:hypothetical protein
MSIMMLSSKVAQLPCDLFHLHTINHVHWQVQKVYNSWDMTILCACRYEGLTRDAVPHGMGVMIFGNGTGGGFHPRDVRRGDK